MNFSLCYPKCYYNWWNGYEDRLYTVWKLGGSETKLQNSKTHIHCVHDKVEHCCFYQYLQYFWSDLIWYIVSPYNLTLVSELSEHLVEKSGFVEFSGPSWCSKCSPSSRMQALSRWRHWLTAPSMIRWSNRLHFLQPYFHVKQVS